MLAGSLRISENTQFAFVMAYSLRKTIEKILVLLLAAVPAALSATTLTWEFTTRQYADFERVLPPLASGTLITSDQLNERGHYEILSATGLVFGRPITGLLSGPGYGQFPPDNAISLNWRDAYVGYSGCYGFTYYPVVIGGAHFSCAGAVFDTAGAPVVARFGGATELLYEPSGRLEYVRTEFVQVVPEAGTAMMLVMGLAIVLVARARLRV